MNNDTTHRNNINPVNVNNHRRGAVNGDELQIELKKLIDKLELDRNYTETEIIHIFNCLVTYNNKQ